ncbi:hypothetical protein NET02_03595 [Thermomicrobiaceae bacterium CFH 74404]|uniref:Uncharacterized protein n=1 Tax=Thermalbibacter longus TaxID=2951981 RepID=A0AA42BBX3_9BACT|nr:hypothetical protein [Thermalbibacter longus]MCM8748218.1 hypothetical protein [Thermalbibacter longus]
MTRVGEGVAALLAELDRVLPVDIWNYPLAELFARASGARGALRRQRSGSRPVRTRNGGDR